MNDDGSNVIRLPQVHVRVADCRSCGHADVIIGGRELRCFAHGGMHTSVINWNGECQRWGPRPPAPAPASAQDTGRSGQWVCGVAGLVVLAAFVLGWWLG